MLSIKHLLTALGPRVNQTRSMPLSIRTMALSSSLTNNINSIRPYRDNGLHKTQKCNLFSESILMIEKLDKMQHYKNQQFGPDKPRYIERVKNLVETGQMDMVLRDDLINLIGLAENEDHIDLIEKIVQTRFQNQPECEEKGWGTTVMRLYYKFGLVDRALSSLTDNDRYGRFFAQTSSYRIVMTMLYNAGRYDEIIEIFDRFCDEKPGFDPENPHYFIVYTNRIKYVVLASLARLNTPEALRRAQTIQIDNKSARSTMFIAYLALKQNDPKLALEYISRSEKANHIAIRSLKISAYLKIKRFEDVLIIIHRSLDFGAKGKQILLQETCDLVHEHENQIENNDIKKELTTAIKELKDNGLVSEEKLESFVFKELTLIKRPQDDMNQRDMRHHRN